MKKRLLVGLATAGIIGGGVYGFAATLIVNSDNLAAGSDAVASCDTSVDAEYEVAWDTALAAYEVTDVDVTNIAAACEDHEVQVTLIHAAGAAEDSAEVTIDATSENFDFSTAQVKAADVTAVHVAIDGHVIP
jgi:hypothetical protein